MIWLQAAVLALATVGDGEPVLLDFTAVWCQPCQQMAPTVDRLAAAGCRVKKIDFDRNKALANRYGVTKIPCFIVLSGNREIGRVVGITSYGNLLGLYQRADQIYKASARNSRAAGETPPPMPMRPGSNVAVSGPPAARPPIKMASANITPAKSSGVNDDHLIAASVRIRVADPKGQSCGTGTIVDARQGWALVLTCGHIFRDSKGKGRIEVDLFGPNGPGRAEAIMVSYDLERDIGLLKFKISGPVAVARVAAPSRQIAVGEPVINVGCNNGDAPTARHSRISSKNKYLGPANLQAGGMPVEGRSGGGLFSADGQVIGVCNCADPKDQEGLYAAGEVIRS
ncbi:MAG: trypsin-like peptidase domain-containing protein, partial [Planctomycetota bacterium]|nr:trypsin-like peptidase domain-containing protein [Planctomycetota bacterium]